MRLQAGDAELILAPEIGGTIVSWTIGGIPMLRPTVPGATPVREQACYPLIPFSNRVAGHGFSFRGTRYELPVILNGYSIHGAAWQCEWRGEGSRMLLSYPGGTLWPFAFDAEQSFDLGERGLAVTMRITNRHTSHAPAALGLHPYFPRTPEMTFQFAATSVWQNGDDMIPNANIQVPPAWDFTRPRTIGDIAVDNCFAGWYRTALFHWPEHGARLSMTADQTFRHLVVYIPQHADFLAVEPVANMNDGLNRMGEHVDHGMTVLAPGETLSGTITFKADLA